jgi:peroxiredoxin
LREHEAEFTSKGARIAAIGLGDKNYAHLFREETGITFPLLIDEERIAYRVARLGVANPFHIFRADNMAHRKSAQARGHRQRIHRLGLFVNPF